VRVGVSISLVAAVLCIGGGTEAARAMHPPAKTTYTLTRAWAGFVQRAGGRPFTGVRATWTMPRIVCNRPSSSVAFWVGLGGADSRSRALEQIGTSVDCSDRAEVSYSAWYEAYPSTAVEIPVVIRPGDAVTAGVHVSGTRVALTFVDDSTGASFARQFTMPAPETDSAEWIAEAPSSCVQPVCTPLPLTRFGRVTFASATSTLTGRDHPLADPHLLNELLAVRQDGRIAARPVAPRRWRIAGSVLG
jgi:peptidase A4-like protein